MQENSDEKITSLLLCFALDFVSDFVWAQNSKKKVASVFDLPRFIYDVPDKLTDLLTDQPLSVSWLKSPSELCKIKNL